jgi:site-specific recombinase XerD
MYIQQAYDLFLAEKKINGYSPKTLAFYQDSAGKLLRSIPDLENMEVARISEFVTPYFLSLQERQISATTRHTYFRGVSAFCRFLHAEGYIDAPVKLPQIKCPQTAIKPLSVEQMRRALHVFDIRRFTGLRNQMILLLFLDTGLRLSELAGIQLTSINFEDGFILVQGKGGKERWVPFGKGTAKALWGYIKKREQRVMHGESALFITQDGNRLAPRGIQIVFRRLKKVLKLEGVRFSPHTLRHSFALAYIENGGDPFSLQHILGHSTQTMTAKYINMARRNVKAQHNKFSPGDRL